MGVCLYRKCIDRRVAALFSTSLCASACPCASAPDGVRSGRCICRSLPAFFTSCSGCVLRQNSFRHCLCADCVRKGAVAACTCDRYRFFYPYLFAWRDPDRDPWFFRNRNGQRDRVLCGACAHRPRPGRRRLFRGRRHLQLACIPETTRVYQKSDTVYSFTGRTNSTLDGLCGQRKLSYVPRCACLCCLTGRDIRTLRAESAGRGAYFCYNGERGQDISGIFLRASCCGRWDGTACVFDDRRDRALLSDPFTSRNFGGNS